MLIAVVHLPSLGGEAVASKVPAGELARSDHPTQQPGNVPAIPANNTR